MLGCYANRYWSTINKNTYKLFFIPFDTQITAAVLTNTNDDDWYFTSKITGDKQTYVHAYDVESAQIHVEDIIADYYRSQIVYYQQQLDFFQAMKGE